MIEIGSDEAPVGATQPPLSKGSESAVAAARLQNERLNKTAEDSMIKQHAFMAGYMDKQAGIMSALGNVAGSTMRTLGKNKLGVGTGAGAGVKAAKGDKAARKQ